LGTWGVGVVHELTEVSVGDLRWSVHVSGERVGPCGVFPPPGRDLGPAPPLRRPLGDLVLQVGQPRAVLTNPLHGCGLGGLRSAKTGIRKSGRNVGDRGCKQSINTKNLENIIEINWLEPALYGVPASTKYGTLPWVSQHHPQGFGCKIPKSNQ
jgi:hypothetical protein